MYWYKLASFKLCFRKKYMLFHLEKVKRKGVCFFLYVQFSLFSVFSELWYLNHFYYLLGGGHLYNDFFIDFKGEHILTVLISFNMF